MSDFHEEHAKRLYEPEREALDVLRLVVQLTERGLFNFDAALIERAKAIVERYDRALTRGPRGAWRRPVTPREIDGAMPRFDKLSPKELEEIKRFIEETGMDVIDDEIRELVEERWPWLVAKLPPRTSQ